MDTLHFSKENTRYWYCSELNKIYMKNCYDIIISSWTINKFLLFCCRHPTTFAINNIWLRRITSTFYVIFPKRYSCVCVLGCVCDNYNRGFHLQLKRRNWWVPFVNSAHTLCTLRIIFRSNTTWSLRTLERTIHRYGVILNEILEHRHRKQFGLLA